MRSVLRTLVLPAFLSLPSGARAQETPQLAVADSTQIQRIRLSDGSTLVGRITATTPDSVFIRTAMAEIRLPRAAVKRVETASAARLRNGEFWPENPNATRLLFGPTGRQLKKGDGYFSSYELVFLGVSGGVTDRVTLGGGMSIIPVGDNFFGNNIYYFTPKIGLFQSPGLNISIGGLFGALGSELTNGDGGKFGIVYGVGTAGSSDHSVTFGTGFTYYGTDFSAKPLFMLGTEQRLSRRLSFVSENYLVSGEGAEAHGISYGVRFMGEKLSIDLALLNNLSEGIFPGIPFLGFVFAF